MKSFKLKTQLKEHGSELVEVRETLIVLSDKDDLDYIVQMLYGSWYDIISFEIEPTTIFVSRQYCIDVVIDELNEN
jgi:putative sterol carrier protein